MFRLLDKIKRWFRKRELRKWAKSFYNRMENDDIQLQAVRELFPGDQRKWHMRTGVFPRFDYYIYLFPFVIVARSDDRKIAVVDQPILPWSFEKEHYIEGRIKNDNRLDFTLDMFSDENWPHVKEFMDTLEQNIADTVERMRTQNVETEKQVRKKLPRLVAKTGLEVEGKEKVRCPKCKETLLVDNQHGSAIVCSCCKQESVLVVYEDANLLENMEIENEQKQTS